MPFPNPQILNAFVDTYINKRQKDWSSFAETIKWFLNIAPWSTYQGESAKKTICDKLKSDFIAPPENTNKEIDKWAKICIYLGETTTATLKLNKASLLAKYLHAIRTYILATLNNSSDTKLLLDQYISNLKSKSSSQPEVKPTDANKDLLELAFLGNNQSITEARKQNLLSMYDVVETEKNESKPYYFEDNYYATKFFAEELKPNSTYVTFEDFQTGLTPSASKLTQENAPLKLPINEQESKKSIEIAAPAVDKPQLPPPVDLAINTKTVAPVSKDTKEVEKNPDVKQENKLNRPLNLPPISLSPAIPSRGWNSGSKRMYSKFGTSAEPNEQKIEKVPEPVKEPQEEIKSTHRNDKKPHRVVSIRGKQTIFTEAPTEPRVEEEETHHHATRNNARRRKRN